MPTYFFIILLTFFSDTFAVLIGQSFPTHLIWRQGSTVARGPRCPFAFFFVSCLLWHRHLFVYHLKSQLNIWMNLSYGNDCDGTEGWPVCVCIRGLLFDAFTLVHIYPIYSTLLWPPETIQGHQMFRWVSRSLEPEAHVRHLIHTITCIIKRTLTVQWPDRQRSCNVYWVYCIFALFGVSHSQEQHTHTPVTLHILLFSFLQMSVVWPPLGTYHLTKHARQLLSPVSLSLSSFFLLMKSLTTSGD